MLLSSSHRSIYGIIILMFRNRKTIHKVLSVLAVVIIASMLVLTIGPGLFGNV